MTLYLMLLNFYCYYASPQGHPNYSSIVVSSQFSLVLKIPNKSLERARAMRSSLSTKSFRNCPCLHPSKHTIFFAAPGMVAFFHQPPHSSCMYPHLSSLNRAARFISFLKSRDIIPIVVLLSRKSVLYHTQKCMG